MQRSIEVQLESRFRQALELLKGSGFEIKGKVRVQADLSLQIMGYARPISSGHVVVVSGNALQSPMLMGLLLHELCHVYRTETDHPSHNHIILEAAIQKVAKIHNLNQPYHFQILRQAVNHIQDLYADDILIEAWRRNPEQLPDISLIGNFFVGWLKTTVQGGNREENAWGIAAAAITNAFAIGNIKRHNLGNLNEATKINQEFLQNYGDAAMQAYSFFENYNVTMRESVMEKEFAKELEMYLEKAVECSEKAGK